MLTFLTSHVKFKRSILQVIRLSKYKAGNKIDLNLEHVYAIIFLFSPPSSKELESTFTTEALTLFLLKNLTMTRLHDRTDQIRLLCY